jgi:hypothetical protein
MAARALDRMSSVYQKLTRIIVILKIVLTDRKMDNKLT